MNILTTILVAATLSRPVTLIEHSYGPRVVECQLVSLDYNGDSMIVAIACDGIFRGGFDATH